MDLLDQDQIVEVVNACGIGSPVQLVREIVNQAEGRPGLAVTLSDLCIRGGIRDVALGDALSGSLLPFFDSIIGSRSKFILAAFAIGGESGLPIEAVANVAGVNFVDLADVISKLEAGGVIRETRTRCISVRPPALRQALIRDVVFNTCKLPAEELVACAPNQADAVLELIASRHRGAKVPDDLLLPLLESSGLDEAWEAFASLGGREATFVLQTHPDLITAIAHPVLHFIPHLAIPALLTRSVSDGRELRAWPDHPLRLIQDWIKSADPGTDEAIKRRQLLWRPIRKWLLAGRDSGVGCAALRSVLSPGFEQVSEDPGRGKTVTIRWSGPTESDIRAVGDLWSEVAQVLEEIVDIAWYEIRAVIEDWAYPGRLNAAISDETRRVMESLAGTMLRDVVALAANHPAVLHWADPLMKHLGINCDVPLDPVFESLYPEMTWHDWKNELAQYEERARNLAQAWAVGEPRRVASLLTKFERAAESAGITWPRMTPLVCAEIARVVSHPEEWLNALIDTQAPPDSIEPFLFALATIDHSQLAAVCDSCLDNERLQSVAVRVVLMLDDPPPELLDKTMNSLSGYHHLVETLTAGARVTGKALHLLLRHEDRSIAEAAAIGAWMARGEAPIDESLHPDWCAAVIGMTKDDHWIAEILAEEPTLGYGWLRTRLAERFREFYRLEHALETAIAGLDTEQRLGILSELTPTYGLENFVWLLVGDDLQLYETLVACPILKCFHLTPLAGQPDQAWITKVRLALDAGYGPDEIAEATVWGRMGIVTHWGSEAPLWAERRAQFEALLDHTDMNTQAVAKAGQSHMADRERKAAARERKEAIFGRA